MSSRHERGAPNRVGKLPANTDIEDAMAAIGVLRGLLVRQEVLRHPTVRAAIQELLELVALFLGHADPQPGRHRVEAAPTRASIVDIPNHTSTSVLKAVNTTAGFMEALRQYRIGSGNPSWRTIRDRAGVAAHSTIYNAVKGNTLPKPEAVREFIIGCGGGEDDQVAFLLARERIAAGRTRRRPVASGTLV